MFRSNKSNHQLAAMSDVETAAVLVMVQSMGWRL